MTGRAIDIRIYKSRAERRCEYSAVAAYVRASAAVVDGIGDGCCNIAKMCRRTAGFGVVDGRKSNIHRLVEMVQRADPRTVVAGGADSGEVVQGVMSVVSPPGIRESCLVGGISMARGAVEIGQWRGVVTG